jgi:vacuolar-type H+-ATPase subunit H
MTEPEAKMFDLIDALGVLCDEGIPVFPGRSIVDTKKLYRILNAFPNAVTDEINDARIILKKKDEILQEAKLRAERIIQDAENERYKLLNESSLNKAMEEHAEKFRQTVFEECQQIRAAAANEAQEIRLSARNDSMRMKEGSQEYAQQLLNNLEQDLNRLYQVVKNGQTSLQEMKANDSMNYMRENQ